MVCEIINPSDPYTIECESFLIGAVAVYILGGDKMALQREEGDDGTPILFGREGEEWIADRGVPDVAAFVDQNKLALADALASVRIGSVRERSQNAVAIAHMTVVDAEKYLAEFHDKRRSSMNDIGGRAWQLAKRLRWSAHNVMRPYRTWTQCSGAWLKEKVDEVPEETR